MKNQKWYQMLFLFTFLCFFSIKIEAQGFKEFVSKNKPLNFFELKEKVQEENLLDKWSEKDAKRYSRWEWFWKNRTNFDGDFTDYEKSIKNYLKENTAKISKSIRNKSGGTPIWTSIGPDIDPDKVSKGNMNGIGRMECIRIDPTNSENIYAGAANGGLWKSTDGGDTWTNLTDDYYVMGIIDIEVNPDRFDEFYILSGATHALGSSLGIYGIGIWKSIDGGLTYTQINFNDGTNVINSNNPVTNYELHDITPHPENFEKLYITTTENVYNIDLGNSNPAWQSTHLGVVSTPYNDYTNTKLKFHKYNNKWDIWVSAKSVRENIYWNANYKYDGNLYRATDVDNTPLTFTPMANKFYGADSDYQSNYIHYTTMSFFGDDIYAIVSHKNHVQATYPNAPAYPNNTMDLMKSSDNGETWTAILNDKRLNAYYTSDVDFNISSNGIGYAFSAELYRMDLTQAIPAYKTYWYGVRMHPDPRDVVFDETSTDEVIYIAHDGGIDKFNYTQNVFTPFGDKSRGLVPGQYYDMDITQSDPYHIIGGAHDNGSHAFNSQNNEWSAIGGGDGGTVLVDKLLPSSYFITTNKKISWRSHSSNSIVYKSIGTGHTYDAPLAQNPQDPKIIYMVEKDASKKYNLYKVERDNNGNVLQKTSIEIPNGHVKQIEFCENNANYLYYIERTQPSPGVHSNNVRKSSNGGVSFVTKNGPSGTDFDAVRNECPIANIEVHPSDPNHIWASFGGFKYGHKVFESFDGGDNWNNISFGLENFPINCLQYDAINNILYAGSDVGVYFNYLSDPTTNFSKYGAVCGDFPNAIVSQLRINRITDELFASTYGRGIWKAPLYCGSQSVDLTLTTNVNNSVYKASRNITSNAIIANQTSAKYIAGNSIILHTGFSSKDGSNFNAKVESCYAVAARVEEPKSCNCSFKTIPTSILKGEVTINSNTENLYLENENNFFKIGPNPNNGVFNILFEFEFSQNEVRIEIVDISGKLIKSLNNINQKQVNIDISQKAAKTYFIKVFNGKDVYVDKVVVITN